MGLKFNALEIKKRLNSFNYSLKAVTLFYPN